MNNNKRALFLGLFFVVLSFFGMAEAAPELTIGTVNGAPGEQALVPVTISSDGSIVTLQFDIQYDSSQLTAADPVPSSSIAGIYTVHSSEPSAGLRRILIVPPESNPVLGSGLLLDIPFTINPAASYQSEALIVTAVVMSDSSTTPVIPTSATDGSINIEPSSNPVAITTTSLSGATTGQAYSQALAAIDGASPYSWSISSGTLPQGLTLNTTSGLISGNPTQAGTTNFTVQVEDSINVTDSQSLSITAVDPLAIGTSTLPGGTTGTLYSQTLSASGGTAPYSWSLSSGALPTGLSLNVSTGEISGAPSVAGTANFTVQVQDSVSIIATQALSIQVIAPLAIDANALPDGNKGTAYSQTLAASGGTVPYSWNISSGNLPAGLVFNTSTGEISGTPTATGTTNFTAQVQDDVGAIAESALSIVIAKKLPPGKEKK